MKAICDARRPMPRSWRSSGTACRSRRSSAEPGTVVISFARSVAAQRRMSSGHGRARSTPTCPSGRQWGAGCRNGAELWRRLQVQGFQGSLRVVSEWTTRRRRAEKASNQQLQKVPSARTIARLMTTARDQSEQSRYRYHCRHRGARAHARRSPHPCRWLPGHAAQEDSSPISIPGSPPPAQA